MITKKDFIAIADIIKKCGNMQITIEMADYLTTRNKDFNRDKFIDACRSL